MDARFISHSSIAQGAALIVLPYTIWRWEGIEKLEYSELKSTIYTVDLELPRW